MIDATQIRTVVIPENSPEAPEGTPSVTPVAHVPNEITPEIVAVIQAAANEFFGRRVRILSIKILPEPNPGSDRWLQRGRDTIQASHNLVQQRH
jgi:hypothetical protein